VAVKNPSLSCWTGKSGDRCKGSYECHLAFIAIAQCASLLDTVLSYYFFWLGCTRSCEMHGAGESNELSRYDDGSSKMTLPVYQTEQTPRSESRDGSRGCGTATFVCQS
jgi:hypothetical protein